tara:strand:- start:33 stop:647 length:615 start_codon:yes stop_codon:yes gene_type:complete
MSSDVTFINVRKSFQAVAGLQSMTETDNFFFEQSLNRAVRRAYDESPSWARYLVSSEERTLTSGNVIPFAQGGKNTINEFIRIHRTQAFQKNSALEYDFYVDSNGANILNITNDNDTSAFVTYKKEYTSTFTETSTDVPAEFFDFIVYSVLSDFYTGDGQTEKALIAEQSAKKMLDRELFKIDIRSNNNSINHKFSTYVNRQSR